MQEIFESSTVRNSLTCVDTDGTVNSGLNTYTPLAQDGRKLRLDTTISGDRILVDFNIRAVAFAVNSETLNGKTESSFLNVNNSQSLNQFNAESIFSRYTKLDAILNNFNSSGTALGANVTGTAANVTGVVGLANGGTGATSAAAARTSLGLGPLAVLIPSGTADATTYLRGDGTWQAVGVGGAVSSVAGRTGAVTLTASDIGDFNSAADLRIAAQKGSTNGLASLNVSGQVPSSQLSLIPADIPGLDYSKIVSGTPTTVAGYGITDAVRNLGSGAGNVVTGIQSGNTAGRPAFGTDGRLYIDTQAGVIYRDSGSAWVPVSATGGGTITDVVAGTGLAGGGSSGSVSVALSNIAANSVLANTTGSAAAPVANTISQILDGITTVQGSVLYRNASGWTSLTPGTSGHFLQTQGAAANPQWAAAAAGGISSLTGDVTASGTGAVAATVAKLQGYDVATTSPVDGKFLKYIGSATNKWSPSDIQFSDIKNSIGNSAFVGMGSCTIAQTVKWSSLTDTFECQSIGSLDGAVIATGVVSSARLPAAAAAADGIVNQIAQSFSGVKTFVNNVIMQGTLSVTGLLTASGGISATGDVSATGTVSADRIKVANSSATCDNTIEGSLRYNSTSKKMEYCNGTAWTNISSGVLASLAIGSPSSSLVKSGPVTFTITYGTGVDTATITLASGNVTLGGTATAGCSVTGVTGSGSTRTVTVNSCSGTGSVNISVAANTASSTTGETAPAAGPSSSYNVDNTGPTAPTGVSLGAVPSNLTNSPTITYSAASDVGGSTVANHQVRIEKTSDSSVVLNWTNHTSGSDVGSLSLSTNTGYTVYVRAVDALGNNGTATAGNAWTSINDPCLGSPSPGTSCAGGAIFLGTLSSDKYMTTPGGCGDIPVGQRGGGADMYSYWPNADFTPTCSGTDSSAGLTKYWNDGSANWYDIPALQNYTTTAGTGQGGSNTDSNYGSTNTTNIVAITAGAQGGYHPAARYCDRLSYGGYTDWYLPNRYELNLMWTNVGSIPGLDTSGTWYWSSTEYTTTGSWMQRFSDGNQSFNTKNSNYRVRCVRRY